MLSDLRNAFRSLLRSPGFTAIAILTLALGIGLNTSMFSLMSLLVLQPMPFPQKDQIVRIYRTTPQTQTGNHSVPAFMDLAAEAKDIADLAAYRMWGYTLNLEGRPPVSLNALRVTAGFFPALGLKPELGRFFAPGEDQVGNHVMILSYATWQAQFGGDPNVIGRTVKVDNESTTIVGVMPNSFSSVFLWGPGDVFRPFGFTETEKRDEAAGDIQILGRLHPGITLDQFNTRLRTLAERLAPLRPKENSKDGLRAVTLESTTKNPQTIGATVMLLALAGFVLLIACANLANLQLARAIARAHEFAVRAALGASRNRLLRPLLGESLLLAMGGGIFGSLVAVWTNDWLSTRLSANGFVKFTLSLDWKVMVFAFVLSTLTGLIFGIVPAWITSRVRVNDTLKVGSRGSTGDRAQHRLRHSLIVMQFANALVLLAGAGFFITGVNKMMAIDPGWNQHTLAMCVLNLPPAKYSTPTQSHAFYRQVQDRLSALPGVENVTVTWTLPIFQYLTSRTFIVQGREPPLPGHEPVAAVNGVEPSYLDTLGIKLSQGRNFTAADGLTSPPVAIINESLARALFPDGQAVGQHIGVPDPKNQSWAEVVGVVPDTRMAAAGLVPTSSFLVLRPLAQETWNYVTVAVRTARPEALVEPLRQTISALDPTLAIQMIGTVDAMIQRATGAIGMIRTVLLCFAGLGLFLSALGLYGVIARLVVQRTPEIGIRMALGAQSTDVIWLILGTGVRLILWGAGIGMLGSMGLSFILSRFNTNNPISVNTPLIFVSVTVILLVVGVVACWLPARRAAKVDPLIALRAE
ncbi:MAG TPA: ABC transporter permease [Lacunisphaera sp.]|nr:ABC transporter permease [Lacunisphaera sp.]